MKTFKYIEIISFKNQEVIRRVDVTRRNEKYILLVDSSMNRNLNHEKYFTKEVDSITELELI